MKSRFSFVIAMVLMLAAAMPATAQESQSTIHFSNTVTVTARHCQKYMSRDWRSLWTKKRLTESGIERCNADPTTVFYESRQHNLVTNAGFDAIASQVGNTGTQDAACNYVAMSNDATAPAATDTTLTGEIAVNGLSRAQGTYSHTGGTKTFRIQKVFTFSGTQSAQKSATFNASSAGTMCTEAAITSVSGVSGDTVTVNWDWTLS